MELVHRSLAGPVLRGQPSQCRYLVVGVVVNVGPGVRTHVRGEEVEEVVGELRLLRSVVRPEVHEVPIAVLQHPDAVEVLQSSVRIVGIALDVVEEVALVGFGKQVEAAAVDLLAKYEFRITAGAPGGLQAGLDPQPLPRLSSHARYARRRLSELGHRTDPRLAQLVPLHACRVRDEGEAVRFPPDLLAVRLPAAQDTGSDRFGTRHRAAVDETLEDAS